MRIIQKKLKVLLVFVTMLTCTAGFAQQKTVNGKVTDAVNGEPLPGVTIVVKGTTSGAATNFDGNYTIGVESGQTLTFSFIGYTAKDVVVGAANVLNVQLEQSMEKIDEVIVIGYGSVKKERQF